MAIDNVHISANISAVEATVRIFIKTPGRVIDADNCLVSLSLGHRSKLESTEAVSSYLAEQ